MPIRFQYSIYRKTIFFCSRSGRITLAMIRLHSVLELALSLGQRELARIHGLAVWHITAHQQGTQSVLDLRKKNMVFPMCKLYFESELV